MKDRYILIVFFLTLFWNQSVYSDITFSLGDRIIGPNQLSNLGISTGDLFQYNGSNWILRDFRSLSYAGSWDAQNNTPNLSGGGTLGQFYIISVDGTSDLLGGPGTNDWEVGDWVLWNNNQSIWEQVQNASRVTSFMGRIGNIVPQANDYTWSQIDKNDSSLADLSDVNVEGVQVGQILKWNGSFWIPGDDIYDGVATAIDTLQIDNNSLINENFSTSAMIDQSKIAELEGDLAGLFNIAEGELEGDLIMGTNHIMEANLIDGISISLLNYQINQNTNFIPTRQLAFLKADFVESSSDVLTIIGGIGAVSTPNGNNLSLMVNQANSTEEGYLSTEDWNRFYNKQDAIANALSGLGVSGQIAYYNTSSGQTSSNNLMFDGNNLIVGGEIDFGNNGMDCNTSRAGEQRYNSIYKNMQYCDGYYWREIGNSFWASSENCIVSENSSDEMVPVGNYCVDRYEASVWSDRQGLGTQYFHDSTSMNENYPVGPSLPLNFNRNGSGVMT